jgi:hypothetical protein
MVQLWVALTFSANPALARGKSEGQHAGAPAFASRSIPKSRAFGNNLATILAVSPQCDGDAPASSL